MKASFFIVGKEIVGGKTLLCVLPTLISCFKTSFNSYEFDGTSFVFKGMYMFNKQDSPSSRKDGVSRINFNYTATPLKPNTDSLLEMDVAIFPESAFDKIGYIDKNNKKVLCCDSEAVKSGKCTRQGHILIPQEIENTCAVKTVSLKDAVNRGSVSLDTQSTGVYFVAALSCDKRVGVVRFEGEYEAINPYGELPAPMYGSLPFTALLFFGYIIMLAWWLYMCIKYVKEVMSVHIIVLVVLACFVVDMGIKLIYLTVYNRVGRPVFFLAIFSTLVDCSTRTLTRILTLFVCMGLGVTKANLDDSLITCEFVVFGLVYYIISFVDSYLNIFPSDNNMVEIVRFVLTSSIDAIVYFWIFVSLMDTMETLVERKQEVKLAIYKKLRALFIISVIIATGTLVAFSYVVLKDLSAHIWKYQWFINDGIWGLFYILLFVVIMIMWMPSENTSAYAYHMQVATTDEPGEGYAMPEESLVDMEGEEHFIVEEVSAEMKPMQLVELVQQEQ